MREIEYTARCPECGVDALWIASVVKRRDVDDEGNPHIFESLIYTINCPH